MEEREEKLKLLVEDLVADFERRCKPINMFNYIMLCIFGVSFVASILPALFWAADKDTSFVMAAGSMVLIFVFYQRLDQHRACMFDISSLRLMVVASGEKGLLEAIRKNSCKEINSAFRNMIAREVK